MNASAAAGRAAPGVMHFDTLQYQPSLCADDAMGGCIGAAEFFGALLDVHLYWARTWRDEGRMEVELPARNDTDGAHLGRQAQHSLMLDMITRVDTSWPRYGTSHARAQPLPRRRGAQAYAASAHSYTRGTFIAPESTNIDRTQPSPPFCTPAGMVAPLYLKWMLVIEDPATHTLWLARALPRVWLSTGEVVRLTDAPTAYGRLSLTLHGLGPQRTLAANLTLPVAWADGRGPPGGLRLRLRVPGPAARIGSVRLADGSRAKFDAASATVSVSAAELASPRMLKLLQQVVVSFVV